MKNILFLLFCVPTLLSAQQLRVDADTSYISYDASHPVHDWSGTSKEVKGVVALENNIPSRMAIVATISSFDSQNSNRDAHAVEVLEALLFPKVSFYSENIALNGDQLELNGKLKFHGISLPLTTTAQWTNEKEKWILEGDFEVQPSGFGIKLPSFMLVKMKDNLKIAFRLELRTFTP